MGRSNFREEHSCTGKLRYVTRGEARKAANALRARGASDRPGCYKCLFCAGWHITSNTYHGTKPIKVIRRIIAPSELDDIELPNRPKPYILPPPAPAVTNLGQLLQEKINMQNQAKPQFHTRCRASEQGKACDLEAQVVLAKLPLCAEHAAKICQTQETR